MRRRRWPTDPATPAASGRRRNRRRGQRGNRRGRDVGRVVRTIVVAGAVAGLRSAVVAVVAEPVVPGRLTGDRRTAGRTRLAGLEAAAPATAPASTPPRAAAVARIRAGRAAAPRRRRRSSASSAPAGAAAGSRRRRRRQRRPRPILHDALERAGAALVEVEPRAQRLDQHPQVLHFDAQPRRLDDEVVEHLEVERVQLVAGLQALADAGEQLAVLGVDRRLQVQRVRDGPDVHEQLEQRAQELADAAQDAARQVARRAERQIRIERVLGREFLAGEEERRRLVLALEVAEQVGADGARVEEAIELDAGQLADLRLGVVGAALVTDPRPDLAHDLLDVNVISADGEIRHGLPATAR